MLLVDLFFECVLAEGEAFGVRYVPVSFFYDRDEL